MKPREKSLVFTVYEEAMKELRAIAAVESSIIVSYSGGKGRAAGKPTKGFRAGRKNTMGGTW